MAKVKRIVVADADAASGFSPTGEYGFVCPGCGEYHAIQTKGNHAWEFNGNVESPTFKPSLLVRSGHYIPEHHKDSCWCTYNKAQIEKGEEPAPFICYVCHSFITDGKIQFLSDCTHSLAGQTVELPEIENK